jgi:hypothetical protein
MQITNATRRDIADALIAGDIDWAGRLDESAFLSRLFDLASLPSTDRRFPDAAGDIWQHRVNNSDWQADWVFYDSRFNLMGSEDEVFLRFLCETIHPSVRSDPSEAQQLASLYNAHLRNDGFQLVETTRISGKPVFAARFVGLSGAPGIAAAREALAASDPGYVAQQITRMEAAVYNDPPLAIGTAKELVETTCKTVLRERRIDFDENLDLPQLVKLVARNLQLTPDDVTESGAVGDALRRLLGNLGSVTYGVAELRNLHGTGHGKAAGNRGLSTRHAKLAVGAAATLAVFLVDSHREHPQ